MKRLETGPVQTPLAPARPPLARMTLARTTLPLMTLSLGLLLTACGGTGTDLGASGPTTAPAVTAPATPQPGQTLAARLGVTSYAQAGPSVLPDLADLQREAGDTSGREVVVGYSSAEQLAGVTAHLGATVKATVPQLRAALLVLPDTLSAQRTALALNSSGLRYAEINHRDRSRGEVPAALTRQGLSPMTSPVQPLVDTDPLSNKQWWIQQIRADQVRGVATGKGVVVAVVDDDFDRQHEDLKADGKIVTGLDTGTFKLLTPDMPLTTGNHGSGSAGTIAQRQGNGKGGVGVAPDAILMPIRIFDDLGYTGDFNVAAGLVWAVDNGAKILNNSWGGGGYGQLLKDAVDYALKNKVVVVGSAGNDHRDLHNGIENFPGVISVGASAGNDLKADFSNVGDRVDLYAPGDSGLTTYINESLPPAQRSQSYGLFGGTSMAGPVVAGAAALLLDRAAQLGVQLTPYQIKKMLVASGDPMKDPRLPNDKRVNVLTALTSFSSAASVPADGGSVRVQVSDLVMGAPLGGTNVILTPLAGQNKGMDYLAQTSYGSLSGAEKDPKGNAVADMGSASFYGIEPGEYEVRLAGTSWASVGGSRSVLSSRITVKSGQTVQLAFQHEADLFEYTNSFRTRNGSPATSTDLTTVPVSALADGLLTGGTFSNDSYLVPPAPGVAASAPDVDFHRYVVPAGKTLTVNAIASAGGSKAVVRADLVGSNGSVLSGATTSAGGLEGLADFTATYKAATTTTVYVRYSNTTGTEGLGHWYGSLITIK